MNADQNDGCATFQYMKVKSPQNPNSKVKNN